MGNRLHKSRTNRVLAGVCGGLGEYFDIDPTFVRLLFALLVIFNGIGILAYIVLWIVMPEESSADLAPRDVVRENIGRIRSDAERLGGQFRPGSATPSPAEGASREEAAGTEASAEDALPSETGGTTDTSPVAYSPGPVEARTTANRQLLAGATLVILGVLFLLDNLRIFWWLSWGRMWPLVLVAIGAWLLYDRSRARRL